MRKRFASKVPVIGLMAGSLAGCATIAPGVDKLWPDLVVISGYAFVPPAFSVAAELRPARGLTIRLARYGRLPWAAVALGRVAGDDGRYSVSVPVDYLPAVLAPYEVQALDPTARVLLASPVGLAAASSDLARNLDPATTIVALAARQGVSARPIETWDVAALAKLPEVRAAAIRLAAQPLAAAGAPTGTTAPVARSAPTAPVARSAPTAPGISDLALLPGGVEPPEVKVAIGAISRNLAAP